MLILRAVVDQQQDACRGQALHQTIEAGLGLGVDPVEILDDEDQGLDLAFPQQQVLEGFAGTLAALRRIEVLPQPVLDRQVQQGEEGWQGWPKGRHPARPVCR